MKEITAICPHCQRAIRLKLGAPLDCAPGRSFFALPTVNPVRAGFTCLFPARTVTGGASRTGKELAC